MQVKQQFAQQTINHKVLNWLIRAILCLLSDSVATLVVDMSNFFSVARNKSVTLRAAGEIFKGAVGK